MKKLVIIMIIAFAPVFLLAQETPLSALYDNYVGQAGFTTTEILPGSTSFEWEATGENNQVKEMMKDIESIRIVKYDAESGKQDQEKIWKKMQKTVKSAPYTEVVTVNSDNVHVNMYMLKGNTGNTREIAILEKDKDGIAMLAVKGDLNFSEMFSPENMKGLREMGEYFMQQKGGCSHHEE